MEVTKIYWNFRVMESVDPKFSDDKFIGITEVFYESNTNEVIGWVNIFDYGCPYGESIEDLKETFENMKKAFDEPVLNEDKLLGSLKKGEI